MATGTCWRVTDMAGERLAGVIDVVVPVKDGAARLPELMACLSQLQMPPGMAMRWYFVDDGSNDASHAFLVGRQDPQLSVLHHPENRGRAAACNTGAAAGSGDFLLILDVDCMPRSTLLLEHMQQMNEGKDVSFGPVRAAGDDFWSRYQCLVADTRERRALAGDFSALTTANMLIRRRLFDAVGGFDSAYARYGFEDRDLINRLAAAGAAFGYAARAVVEHRLDGDLAAACRKMESAGCSTAPLYRARYLEQYQRSAFAKVDYRLSGPGRRLLLNGLSSLRRPLISGSSAVLHYIPVPFRMKLFVVRVAEALSYYAGTRQQELPGARGRDH